jgi:hypothetical protein
LIRAILEAEDRSEHRLAEIALAILLLSHNYRLAPADFEQLLGAPPDTSQSGAWPHAFEDVANDHIQSFLNVSGISPRQGPVLEPHARSSRVLAWVRNHWPTRWFSFESRR